MASKIAIIFGAGKRIGASTVQMLVGKGYKVALTARSPKSENNREETLHLVTDLSDPESVASAFATVRKQWGEPNVVIYNGSSHPTAVPVRTQTHIG